MNKSILFFCLFFIFVPFALAEDGDFLNVEQVGFFDYWCSPNQIIVTGNLAHISTGISGYHIVDISDYSNPVELNHYLITGRLHFIKIVGNYAYLLSSEESGTDLFIILDISDPANVFELGRIEELDYTRSLDICGQYALINNIYDGILIVDISDPSDPTQVQHYRPGAEIYDLVCNNNRVYLAEGSSGLTILDGTDPVNLVEISNNLGGNLQKVFYENGYIFAESFRFADFIDCIYAFDVSDPEDVDIVSQYSLSEDQELNNFVDGKAITVDSQLYVDIIDYSIPDSPTLFGSWIDNACVHSAVYTNNTLFIGPLLFTIIDFSTPESPSVLSTCGTGGSVECIKFVGEYGYSGKSTSFRTYDFTDPTNPLLLDILEASDSIWDFAIANGYCYLLELDGTQTFNYIEIINIEDPSNVYSEGVMNLRTRYSSVDSFGDDYVYLSSMLNGVRILDVSVPLEPVLRGEIQTSGIPQAYDKIGYYLYCVDDDAHLTISLVLNPEEPQTLASYEFSAPENPEDRGHVGLDIKVDNDFAYVPYVFPENGYPMPMFEVFNVSDFENISLVNSIPLDHICRSIEISDGYLYMANSFDGFRVFDIDDPTNIQEVGYYDSYGECFDVKCFEEYVVVAEMYFMEVFDCSESTNSLEDNSGGPLPQEFSISAAYPNPFNPTLNIEVSLPVSSQLDLSIHNIVGQEVSKLTRSNVSAGKHSYLFNGSQLSSGIYFINASIPGHTTQTRKVILMK